MPRSFMIANRRFDDEDQQGEGNKFDSKNISNNISDFNYDRMYHDSPARELARCHVKCAPESPLCTKRIILQRRVADKGVSDGESDSGCSTLTEGSQELAPELEYSWDCPSGFSLLLELMTQSPLKHSGRDVLDLSSDVRSPERRLSREDFDVRSVDENKVARLEEHFASAGSVEQTENTNMHFRLSPQQILLDLKSSERYVFDEGFSKSEIKDFKSYMADGHSHRDFTHSRGLDLTVAAENQKYTTPVYDDFCVADQGTKYHAQRRISFDNYYGRIESPSEQPIDYSQLSSRRKEASDEVKEEKREPRDYSVRIRESHIDKEKSTPKARRLSVEGPKPMDTKASPVTTPKYEFILSPKMDGNGNLVLHQNQQQHYSSFQGSSPAQKPVKEVMPQSLSASYPSYDNQGHTGSYVQQSSPLSGSPASPIRTSSEQKHELASDLAKKKIDQEDAANVRAQIPYHPKLKYLLAATQYAKSKIQQEENRMQATAPGSPPSYHQSILFSQDHNAQVEKFQKATGHMEDVYTESDVAHSQLIPSNDKFQTAVHNHHSANVFIFNPATSINSQTSTTDITEGSMSFKEQQNHPKEIQSSQLKSLPNIQISKSYNGNYNSDQVSFDQAHQSPMAMSPSSPDQPLSPATLRDQQSALSELLFSTNRKPGVDPYACADCGKRYSTSSNLARHRQTHRSVCDKKARKCPHCDKVYVSMPAYSMHVRTHNQGCECPHCGKKFSRPWLLQGHIRTHTGEKPFGCPQCGKSFADKSNLRAHIQTHSTEKPYVCGRCGKAFALKSYLYKHEESSCMRGQRFRR